MSCPKLEDCRAATRIDCTGRDYTRCNFFREILRVWCKKRYGTPKECLECASVKCGDCKHFKCRECKHLQECQLILSYKRKIGGIPGDN